MQELIAKKLQEIEQREHVTILHAVESGSRAWGFASAIMTYASFMWMGKLTSCF